jgi:hypothetical protein
MPRRTRALGIRCLRTFRLGLGTGCRVGTQSVFRSLLSPPGPLGVGYRPSGRGCCRWRPPSRPSRRARGAELALDLVDEVLVELVASIA